MPANEPKYINTLEFFRIGAGVKLFIVLIILFLFIHQMCEYQFLAGIDIEIKYHELCLFD